MAISRSLKSCLNIFWNLAKLSCNLTNIEYETIIDECSEAIKLTKNEILEFMKKYPKQKIFLDSLIECWSENL